MQKHNYSISHSFHKASGVTLIELLVAMVIGLLLVIAASATYLYSRNSYNAVSETSQMEENGRFALNLLSRYVQSAGFVMINPNAINIQGAFINKISGCDFGLSNGINPSDSDDIACRAATPAGEIQSASISMFFDTDTYNGTKFEGLNCIGNRSVETSITDESGAVSFTQSQSRAHFFISTFVSATPNGTVTRRQLSCVGETKIAAGLLSYGSQPLIPGIEQLAVRYLLPSTVSPKVAQRGLTASAVTVWGDVMAVELCVLTRSIQATRNETDTVYTDCYGNPIPVTGNDSYRSFRTTVNLRNRTQAL